MGRRIRVARIITRLNIGGPALHAMLLTERLDPTRYETLLVSGMPGEREGDMRELARAPRVTPLIVAELGRDISPLADLAAFRRLFDLLRRFRPHIVHTHLAKAGLLGRVAARLAGVPIVIHTFHGNVLRGYFDPARTGLFVALERILAKLSTRVIAISPLQAQELRHLAIAEGEKTVEIPLGLDLTPFVDPPRGRLRAELGVGEAIPLIGIVARLVPIKGVDVFIDAAAQVAAKRADAAFVVVGDGELRGELEGQASRRGLASRMHFLGWRADLPEIHADLDIVVLTSHNEGTPVSVIEALAAARPVVATAVGGVPDVLGESERGLLAPDGDASAIATLVLRLLAAPDLRVRLGRSGREHVYPRYDARTLVGRIAALYSALYEQLVEKRAATIS